MRIFISVSAMCLLAWVLYRYSKQKAEMNNKRMALNNLVFGMMFGKTDTGNRVVEDELDRKVATSLKENIKG